MTSDDADYYVKRADTERAMARASTNPCARRVHEELAENYEALVRVLRPVLPVMIEPILHQVH